MDVEVAKPAVDADGRKWERPPARSGAPGRLTYRTGSEKNTIEIENDHTLLKQALQHYDQDKLVAGSHLVDASHRKWWGTRCLKLRWAPYPLTVQKVRMAAAIVKGSGYRSVMGYLFT